MAGWGDGLSREDFPGRTSLGTRASCCRSLSPACGQDARAPRVQDRCGERGSTGSRDAERLQLVSKLSFEGLALNCGRGKQFFTGLLQCEYFPVPS